MARLRLAVIGVGHLGKEHARILASLPEVELVGVADTNPEQAQAVARRCGTTAYTNYWPLLNLVDAAIIAVPTKYHFDITKEFLSRSIPVLVEKPLALNLEQATGLVDLAEQHRTILQVGHIERFNPAFEALGQRPLQPKFIEGQRLGPFTGRSTDIGAVLDLMIHDLDLLLSLVPAPVRAVEAIGTTLFGGHEDVVNARLVFANGCVANLTASRASPRPLRQMRVWAPEGYASLDFAAKRLTLVQPSARLRQHLQGEAGAERGRGAIPIREPLQSHLHYQSIEGQPGDQLTRELQHFVACVRQGQRPRVSGVEGRDAIALATRVLDSVHHHQWEGDPTGPVGPFQLPRPLGPLFRLPEDEAA
ncbi:MAG: Gfo/Idh/MocA family oxidoreductase [Gemmataceae bacterium]